MQENFESMKDESLLKKIKIGNEIAMNFLLHRYEVLIRRSVDKFFLIGGEKEDLLQEGYIGLFKAIQTYDERKNDSFYPFAKLCIENQIRTAVTASNRKKHGPLNTSVSIESDENAKFPSMEENPEQIFLKEELKKDRVHLIENHLSGFEKEVALLYLEGMAYTEIAKRLRKSPKSIDNAIQRVRKKLAKKKEKKNE